MRLQNGILAKPAAFLLNLSWISFSRCLNFAISTRSRISQKLDHGNNFTVYSSLLGCGCRHAGDVGFRREYIPDLYTCCQRTHAFFLRRVKMVNINPSRLSGSLQYCILLLVVLSALVVLSYHHLPEENILSYHTKSLCTQTTKLRYALQKPPVLFHLYDFLCQQLAEPYKNQRSKSL